MVRREGHEQQADDRAGEGDPQQHGRSQAGLETRGRETHDRHHEQEERESSGGRCRRVSVAVDHGQVEPVVRRALHEARAHDHEGDEHGLLLAPGDAREALRLVRRGLSPVALVLSGREGRDLLLRQVEADGSAAGEKLERGQAEEVGAEGQAHLGGERAEEGATEHADRVHRLDDRNDGAAHGGLHEARLDVHGRAPQAVTGGQEHEAKSSQRDRHVERPHPRTDDAESPDEHADATRGPRADLGDDRAGGRQGEQRAEGGDEQHRPDRRRGQPEVIAHVGQAREPRGGAETKAHVDDAGGAQGGVSARVRDRHAR